ncbi:unnamed protein product [Tenebrio molitor]|nr:unnamed protein product [Tenebrio molitor]
MKMHLWKKYLYKLEFVLIFYILCKLLGREWHKNRIGRRSDIRAGIMLSLWYLATKETFREVGDRFGVSRGHAYRI